jgi:hypothetical protein
MAPQRRSVRPADVASRCSPPSRDDGGSFSDLYFPDAQTAEQHREFEVSMQRLLAEHRAEDGTPDETDQLSRRIHAARPALESACRPFLAGPPWLKKLSNLSQKLGRG